MKNTKHNFKTWLILWVIMILILGIAIAVFIVNITPAQVTMVDNAPLMIVKIPFRLTEVVFAPRDWYGYTVQYGDTWWDLAVQVLNGNENIYDVRNMVIDIMAYNVGHGSTLYTGETIMLPR